MDNLQLRDKSMMKDPTTAASRIYIGNLEKETTEEEIDERFKKYGKILGILVQWHFGFVQFESEESALAAIEKEHGAILKGKKMNVRTAITGEGGKGKNMPNLLEGSTATNVESTQSSVPPNLKKVRTRPRGGGNVGGGGIRDRSPLDRDYHKFNNPTGSYPNYSTRTNTGSDRNDCEIIVVSKALTEYAEYIEMRLKNMGLTVDLLFPNEDVPIGRVLANISSRGCLYAILVTPQNEEHRSLTLNILYGLPQEHRNMPVDDAITLISRNFEEYMRGSRNPTLGSLTDRHPEAIQILINLLAENRQLTVLQYDRVLKYLQERRELQLKHELGDGTDIDSPVLGGNKQQAELQNRILSILNSNKSSAHEAKPPVILPSVLAPSIVPKPVSAPGIATNATNTSTSSTPLLNDPSIQKALDSLLQGDLLKNIVKPTCNPEQNEDYGINYSNIRKF